MPASAAALRSASSAAVSLPPSRSPTRRLSSATVSGRSLANSRLSSTLSRRPRRRASGSSASLRPPRSPAPTSGGQRRGRLGRVARLDDVGRTAVVGRTAFRNRSAAGAAVTAELRSRVGPSPSGRDAICSSADGDAGRSSLFVGRRRPPRPGGGHVFVARPLLRRGASLASAGIGRHVLSSSRLLSVSVCSEVSSVSEVASSEVTSASRRAPPPATSPEPG